MLFSALWGDECPDKGYECSVKGYTFYDTSPSYHDLLDQYGIAHAPFKDANGESTYYYGMGHKIMPAHPDLKTTAVVIM